MKRFNILVNIEVCEQEGEFNDQSNFEDLDWGVVALRGATIPEVMAMLRKLPGVDRYDMAEASELMYAALVELEGVTA